MKNFISKLLFTSICLALLGCAEKPVAPSSENNSPEVQRAHAEQSHGQLSSEVRR
jgi:hypothetical protein